MTNIVDLLIERGGALQAHDGEKVVSTAQPADFRLCDLGFLEVDIYPLKISVGTTVHGVIIYDHRRVVVGKSDFDEPMEFHFDGGCQVTTIYLESPL